MITRELARKRWRGVLAPLVTPFERDGGLNLVALRANVSWLLERGAKLGNTVFLAAGSGGEFTSMTLTERLQVIEAVATVSAGRVPIIAGAQSLDIRESIEICRFCESIGVDAVQLSGPFYYDGRPGDVIAWFEKIATKTDVGFAIYNNWYTGYDMPLYLVERLLQIPNSVGLKWSSPALGTFLEGAHQFSPRIAVVNNTLAPVPGHIAGCSAFVSHFPNFYPEFCWEIWRLMEAGEYQKAETEFERAMTPYRKLVATISAETAGEAVFVRPAMEAAGLDGGFSRLPSRDEAVSAEIKDAFRALLSELYTTQRAPASVKASAALRYTTSRTEQSSTN